MRILKLGIWFVSLFVVSIAYAENSPRQSLGMGISYGYQGLALRQIFGKDNLFYLSGNYGKSNFEASAQFNGTTTSDTSSSRNFSVGVGVRHYLSDEKLSDFVQVELDKGYASDNFGSSSRIYSATMGYGFEYFLDSHVSVEARTGVRYSYIRAGASSSSSTVRSTSIPVVGIAITRYW
jgi:hypothetical protein